MIPVFPEFKKLEISDREQIMQYTGKFLPYSDFNFVSMWSWDTDYEFMVSILNDNLVVRFIDYISGDPFLSFIGDNKIHKTVGMLLEYSREKQLKPILRLMPADVVDKMPSENRDFSIIEDRDSFDYILTVEHMDGFKGNHLRGKRNFLNRCERIYSPTSCVLDLRDEMVRNDILRIVKDWMEERIQKGETPNAKEFAAISKLLHSESIPNLIAVGAYIGGRMQGFVMGEVLGNGYAMLHFEKASSSDIVGIYVYLMHSFAVALKALGCEFINHEQDLGVMGLRRNKESLLPIMAKKYIVELA